MPSAAARPMPVRLLVSLFVVTLALRPQLVGIGPLLPRIQADLGVNHAVAGLLTTIPVVCMGFLAPVGPIIAARVGARLALAGCVAAIVVLGLVRAAAPGTAGVLAATVGLGFAMGTAGALMSIVVKERAPGSPALATGAYATGIVLGALVASAVAVPLAVELGGWRAVTAVFAVASIGSLVVWIIGIPPDPARPAGHVRAPSLPWRSPLAWGLAAVFGLQSLLYYGSISWLPDVYLEHGWTEASAGSLTALLQLVSLGAGLLVPFTADRSSSSRRAQMATMAGLAALAQVGFVLATEAGWLWAAVLGFALGGLFPLCLTLPVDVAHGPREVGAAAALMLLGGYLLSGIGPVVLGFARDATGDFTVSLWLLVALSLVLVGACLALTPSRLGRGIRTGRVVLPDVA